MRFRLAIVSALVLLACVPKEDKQDAAGGPSASGARIHFSAQPPPAQLPVAPPNVTAGPAPTPVPSGSSAGSATDGREVLAGRRLHADAKKGCADLACLGNKCGKLCVQFMAETYKEGDFRSVNHRNTIYFNCQGACLADPD